MLILYIVCLQLTKQLRWALQTQSHMGKTIKPEVQVLFPQWQGAETSVTRSRNIDLDCLAGQAILELDKVLVVTSRTLNMLYLSGQSVFSPGTILNQACKKANRASSLGPARPASMVYAWDKLLLSTLLPRHKEQIKQHHGNS